MPVTLKRIPKYFEFQVGDKIRLTSSPLVERQNISGVTRVWIATVLKTQDMCHPRQRGRYPKFMVTITVPTDDEWFSWYQSESHPGQTQIFMKSGVYQFGHRMMLTATGQRMQSVPIEIELLDK